MATLLASQGTPMILMGDEVGRTQRGNNNAYCQDNEISWLDWAHRRRATRPSSLSPACSSACASSYLSCAKLSSCMASTVADDRTKNAPWLTTRRRGDDAG